MEAFDNWAALAGVLTPPGLLLLTVFMFLRGDILARKTVERELQTITESRDHWRSTAESLVEANTLLTQSLADNKAVGESVIRVMQVVQHEAEESKG